MNSSKTPRTGLKCGLFSDLTIIFIFLLFLDNFREKQNLMGQPEGQYLRVKK